MFYLRKALHFHERLALNRSLSSTSARRLPRAPVKVLRLRPRKVAFLDASVPVDLPPHRRIHLETIFKHLRNPLKVFELVRFGESAIVSEGAARD